MKILSLVFGVWCLGFTCAAQQWCPAGAHWYTGYYAMAGPGYSEYTLRNDTTVAGRNCKRIESTRYERWPGMNHTDTIHENDIYTYSSPDTVFFYYRSRSQWLPAFYFNAQVGDVFRMPSYSNHFSETDTALLRVQVDSVGVMQVDTHHLRYYVFHALDSCFGALWFGGKVAERLGMIDNDLIPYWHCITDDYYFYLRCYSDNTFATYSTGEVCDFLPNGILPINGENPVFHLSPNPANDYVILSTDNLSTVAEVVISDVAGKKVMAEQLQRINYKLQTNNLGSGVYFVTLTNRDGKSTTQKLVIQR